MRRIQNKQLRKGNHSIDTNRRKGSEANPILDRTNRWLPSRIGLASFWFWHFREMSSEKCHFSKMSNMRNPKKENKKQKDAQKGYYVDPSAHYEIVNMNRTGIMLVRTPAAPEKKGKKQNAPSSANKCPPLPPQSFPYRCNAWRSKYHLLLEMFCATAAPYTVTIQKEI